MIPSTCNSHFFLIKVLRNFIIITGLLAFYAWPQSATQTDSLQAFFQKTVNDIKEQTVRLINKLPGSDTASDLTPEMKEQLLNSNYAQISSKFQNLPVISAMSLKNLYGDSSLVLIDVREDIEQKVSMLPQALTVDQFAQKFKTPLSVLKKIFVVYSTIGYRSGIYGQRLLPFKINVRNLEGGILAWTHVNGPLVKKGLDNTWIPVNDVHVFREDLNFVHPDYIPKW